MARKRTKTSVAKSLDKLASKAARQLHPTCKKCGKLATEVHHIFGRRNYSVRWTLSNLIPLCSSCHIWSTNSFEKEPYNKKNMEVVLKHVGGEKGLDELRLLAKGIYKSTLQELIDLETEYKKVIK
jgi:hypothetical protein